MPGTFPYSLDAAAVGTIRAWYLNAEGRGVDPSGPDWENDDRPARNPDSWLDRLTPGVASASHDAEPTSATKPAKSRQPAASEKQNGRTSKKADTKALAAIIQEVRARQRQAPAQAEAFERFAEAVRTLHIDKPALGAKQLAYELRQRGWRNFRRSHVVQALAGKRPIMPAPREQPQRPGVVRPTRPTGRNHANTGRTQSRPSQMPSSTSSARPQCSPVAELALLH